VYEVTSGKLLNEFRASRQSREMVSAISPDGRALATWARARAHPTRANAATPPTAGSGTRAASAAQSAGVLSLLAALCPKFAASRLKS
jgi:hypothetical protein